MNTIPIKNQVMKAQFTYPSSAIELCDDIIEHLEGGLFSHLLFNFFFGFDCCFRNVSSLKRRDKKERTEIKHYIDRLRVMFDFFFFTIVTELQFSLLC
jgi:hypothetical protein